RIDEAIEVLVEAVAHEPSHADAHRLLGTAYMRGGQPAPAVRALRRAASLVPDSSQTSYTLAQGLRQLGLAAEATTELQRFRQLVEANRASEARSRTMSSTVSTAMEKLNVGHYEEAVALLNQALALEPHLVEALYTIGFVLLKQERYDEAVVPLEEAVARDP